METVEHQESEGIRRILSIDGGGIKGVFEASFLSALEESIGGLLGDYFDLIVGTSTGGIIALALGLGIPASDVVEFYITRGPRIFHGNRVIRALRSFGISKYDKNGLKNALAEVFGVRTLGEAKTRVLIPSMQIETGGIYIYKTAHHRTLERDYLVSAVDIAMATASAPTYFPTHRSTAGIPMIDGGIWSNNPIAVAVIEGLGMLQWPTKSIRVLSLGCPTSPLNLKKGRYYGLGKIYWANRIVDLFLRAQSSYAKGAATTLLSRQQILRICPVVGHNKYSLDNVREIGSLNGLGKEQARHHLPQLREFFDFSRTKQEFVPMHV